MLEDGVGFYFGWAAVHKKRWCKEFGPRSNTCEGHQMVVHIPLFGQKYDFEGNLPASMTINP